MPDGFTIDLDEAEKACRAGEGSLPQAAALLREPIVDLISYEGWNGIGSFDAVDRVQATYQALCEVFGERQMRACDVMDANAEALREIIALYRRVDGQL